MVERNSENSGEIRGLSKSQFLRLIYLTELALVILSLIVVRLYYGNYFPYNFSLDSRDILIGLASAVPISITIYLLMAGPISRIAWIQRAMSQINEKLYLPFGRSIRSLTIFEIVLISCAAGIGEEIFFRGMMQSFIGVWWAAVVFGLLHALTPAYFIIATAVGIWLGLLYQFSDNLLVPMVAHAAYDIFALNFLRMQYLRRSKLDA